VAGDGRLRRSVLRRVGHLPRQLAVSAMP